jgi:hypothetical protein
MLAHPWLEGQKEAHTKQCDVQTSLESQSKLAEGDPDESVQAVTEQQTAATAIQARFRGNRARHWQAEAAKRHWQAGAAAVMAFAGEHVHNARVTNAQASLAPAAAVAGGSASNVAKGPPPLKKRAGGNEPSP